MSLSEAPSARAAHLPLQWRASITMHAGSSESSVELQVLGELDPLSAPALIDFLDVLAGPGCTHLRIDLSAADFVSADTLRLLDERYLRTVDQQRAVSLVGLPKPALRLAEILDLHCIRDDGKRSADGDGFGRAHGLNGERAGRVHLTWSSDGVAEVTCSGAFDLSNASELRAALVSLLRHPGCSVTMHLGEVTEAASSLLSILVEFHRALVDDGGRLVIADASFPVEQLLRTSGTAEMLGFGAIGPRPNEDA